MSWCISLTLVCLWGPFNSWLTAFLGQQRGHITKSMDGPLKGQVHSMLLACPFAASATTTIPELF